jgi:hypothetical protein
MPEPVQVEEDSSGFLLAVRIPRRHVVSAIEDRWRIDDEWWRRRPVSRLYYKILLSSGQHMVLYKDLIENCWYRQSY